MVEKVHSITMTDWHCHLLPGIDDGPSEIAESLEMAKILVQSGFSEVCCTPHCMRGGYDATSSEVRDAVRELQGRLNAEGVRLILHPGREYYLDEYFSEYLADPLLLGDSRNLLIEIPGYQDPEYVRQTCYRIKMKGYVPVIAHPERCLLLTPPGRGEPFVDSGSKAKGSNPLLIKLANLCRSLLSSGNRESHATRPESGYPASDLCEYLVDIGAKFQGNIGSFAGIYDDQTKLRAQKFLRTGVYTHFGSDAHNSGTLATWLPVGLSCIGQGER